jgi:signal transduction histidine kinase
MKLWQRQTAASQDSHKSILTGQWIFYLIAVVGVLISLFLWYAVVLQSSSNLRHIIQLQTEHVANDVDIQVELRISALKHMAKHLEIDPSSSLANWDKIVEYLNDYGGFHSIEWLDPSFNIIKVSPPNDARMSDIYSRFINEHPQEFQNILQTRLIWLSSIIQKPDDHEDIFVTIPLFDDQNRPLGYLICVLDLQQALNIQLNHVDYAVFVYYDNEEIFRNRVAQVSPGYHPYVSILNLYGSHWKVFVQPSQRFITSLTSHLSSVALGLGICIAILFAITSRLALLARQRAKTLNEINLNLKNEIAERIQAEESKQKLEKALQQGQKLQAIGTLAGGIAHDFNNILYAIIGYVEMAREDVPEGSLVYNNLGKVLEGSHRGRDLIARILAFGRRQLHHDFHPVPLKSVIENVLGLLRATIPASVAINYIVGISDDYKIYGNEIQLHQIMVNLINNAVDAMDGDGSVTIRVEPASLEDRLTAQLANPKQEYCKIEITDTGYGMDQSTQERIFEPFFTTKEVGKGTGLGLAIVHAIMEDHQGKILVKSQLGHGSVFTIFLPTYLPTPAHNGV